MWYIFRLLDCVFVFVCLLSVADILRFSLYYFSFTVIVRGLFDIQKILSNSRTSGKCWGKFTSNLIFLTRSLFMKIMFGFSIWILVRKTHLILIYNLFWKYTFSNFILKSISLFCVLGRKNIVSLYFILFWLFWRVYMNQFILMIYLLVYLIWCWIHFVLSIL